MSVPNLKKTKISKGAADAKSNPYASKENVLSDAI